MHTKKMEFSKKIFVFAAIFVAVVTLYTFIIVWRTGDTSPLQVLIPGAFAFVTAGISFYYWKARQENIIKLKKYYGQTITPDDVDAAANAAMYEDNTIIT